jgi:hypothetical protein
MQRIVGFFFLLVGLNALSQDTINTVGSKENKEPDYIWIFSAPKLINANTVEMIPKGILEFKITHNFGDIAGDVGGIENFFGLDNAYDVRIGFQYGLSKRINLIAARAKGTTRSELYELGMKYRLMQQARDTKHPLSITFFGNIVASAMESQSLDTLGNKQPNTFDAFSDRLSQTLQLLVARKFGNISLQISPTLVHTNYVMEGDDNTVFALGGGLRVPVIGKFSLLLDYFHSFRSQESIDSFKAKGTQFYDAIGVGVEILTEGHVFHLNFTNATDILENRFIPYTTKSWGKGEFRWGFTISRDFDMFYKKKNRKK